MHNRAIGQDDIHTHERVNSQSVSSGGEPISTDGEVTTSADIGTRPMRKRPPSRSKRQLQVPKPQARAKRCYIGVFVEAYALELLQVDDHGAVLAARAIRTVRVAPGAGLHLELVLGRAEHGVGDMLVAGGDDDRGWLVLEAEVVG